MLSFRKKKDEVLLEDEIAEQMLNNVFDACRFERNTVPLEVLSSYSNYRKERYRLQQTVIVAVMVLFMLLPLLFLASDITLTPGRSQTLRASVSGFVPVQRISAVIEGRNVPIYEIASHEYVIQPSVNGDMTVTVTLMNNQTTEIHYQVSMVDTAAPAVLGTEMDSNSIYLTLSDESGINAAGIRLVDNEGVGRPYTSFDAATGVLVIPYPTESTHVYVPDKAGNELHLLITPT